MASDLLLGPLDQLSREYIEQPTVHDNVFESASTLQAYKRSGMIETGADLGPDYEWMVRHSLPPGPVPYVDYEVFPLTASDPFDRVHLTPKNYAQTLVIPKTKLDANMGDSKLADLISEVMEAGIENFAAGLNIDLHSTENGSGARICGLRHMLALTGAVATPAVATSTDRTYAGVNSLTYNWWRPTFNGSGNFNAANLIDETSAYYIFNVLDETIMKLKQLGQNPGKFIIVTCPRIATFMANESRNAFTQINMPDLKRVDLSPVNIYHQGISIFPDVDCPGSAAAASTNWTYSYFLNKNTTKLIFGKVWGSGGKESKMGIFEWGGWKDQSPKQEVIAGNLKCRLVHVVKQPGANAVIGFDDDVIPLV